MSDSETPLSSTPLTGLWRALGARMCPFAGYDMPLHFAPGMLAEHAWTRQSASLFDVAHMGPAWLVLKRPSADGAAAHAEVSAIAETLLCGDVAGLKPGQMRYMLRTNADGGVEDDLMLARPVAPDAQGRLYLVANAARKAEDFAAIAKAAGAAARIEPLDTTHALMALQGPAAAAALDTLVPVSGLDFMQCVEIDSDRFGRLVVSRSGYTGEDGFEILAPAGFAADLAAALLEDPAVRPAGLGARDSLRLEAGLCLYGHDLDPEISPVEASLAWTIQKRRRAEGGFPGAERILAELRDGPPRRRVGLRFQDRAPAREGAPVCAPDGTSVGRVTSGGFGPSLNAPVAMALVAASHSAPGTPLHVIVRDRPRPVDVIEMPFVPHAYHRKA